jgi:hypothetical protein
MPEPAVEAAPGSGVVPSPLPVAETATPADPDTHREEPPAVPAVDQCDAVPWAEPTIPDLPRWLERGSAPASPSETAPAAEADTAAIRFDTEGHPAGESAREQPPGPSDRSGPRWGNVLLAAFGILLLGIGVYLFRDADSARDMLRALFPPSAPESPAGVAAPAADEGKPAYEVREMDSFRTETFKGGKLFVIHGMVANVGKGASRGILLRATLLGKDNQALADNVVFAGNVVDNTTLRHADREVIRKILSLRYGSGNANSDIPPGNSLPFMAVFFDPPEKFEMYSVKAADAE